MKIISIEYETIGKDDVQNRTINCDQLVCLELDKTGAMGIRPAGNGLENYTEFTYKLFFRFVNGNYNFSINFKTDRNKAENTYSRIYDFLLSQEELSLSFFV